MSGAPDADVLSALLDEVEAADAAPAAPPAGVQEAPPAGDAARPAGAPAPTTDWLNALPGLLRAMGQTGKGRAHPPSDRHTALLRALKPYLSPARRSAVDSLLTLAGVWDALSGMGLRLPLPGIPQAGAAAPAAREAAPADAGRNAGEPETGGEG